MFISRKPLVLLGLIVLSFTQFSCQTYQLSVVKNNTIENPSLGWEGVKLRIPEKYTYLDPASPAYSIDTINKIKKSISGPWSEYSEVYIFGNKRATLIIGLVTYESRFQFNKLAPDGVQFFLNKSLQSWIRKEVYDVEKPRMVTIGTHRGIKLGVNTCDINGNAGNSTGYFILGKLNEGFYIMGEELEEDLPWLDSELRGIINTLAY